MEPKALKAAKIAVCGSPRGGRRGTDAPSADSDAGGAKSSCCPGASLCVETVPSPSQDSGQIREDLVPKAVSPA